MKDERRAAGASARKRLQKKKNLKAPPAIGRCEGDNYDLQTLIAEITAENTHGEVDFGKPVGKEFPNG